MLKRLKPIEIPRGPEEDPFLNDKLGRKQIAGNLRKIITTSDDSLVLSVNAPWGFGKTTFVEMWRQELKNQGYPSIYFNAWEYDYATNPFYSFLGEIQGIVDGMELDPEKKGEVRKIKDKLVKNAGKMFRKSIPLFLRFGTGGLLSLDEKIERDISKALESYVEEAINDYQEEKKTIESFKKNLEKFGKEFIRLNEAYKPPIIIFVDELDRCRPNYAIELLENIKHLFSVEGYVFVLSLDREQLAHSVKSVYGEGMDADGYLRRFIDLEFNMPVPEVGKFCKFLLVDYFKINQYLVNKYGQNKGGSISSELEYLFLGFSRSFNLSLRSMGQICGYLSLVIKLIDEEDVWGATLFLLLLKVNNPEVLRKIKNNQVSGKELLDIFESKIGDNEFLINSHWVHVKAFLLCLDLNPDEVDQEANRLGDRGNQTHYRSAADNALKESMRLLRNVKGRKNNYINLIEFVGEFQV
ncbi:KAP family P-loop NTPase fold protein [Nitrospina watsonii]|uniref:KAP NTPase domain-containing protein n=1 Tax=Nitrospina watsonii TaxID=1323948 RepID=A0ABN8W524_9BACT|nr:P-loop NTPase fold protein [Nitrospina watsonii]CAI2718736.1 putative KAP NTPase domain-containing protein [Nitrospina watsonii]